MKKDSKKAKSPQKTPPHQAPPSPRPPNISDTFNKITFSAQLPDGMDPTSLDRLIHDLRSAGNAFSFLVDQVASNPENTLDDRHRRKLNQLRQHDAVNKTCIDAMITCLQRQMIQGVIGVPFNLPN